MASKKPIEPVNGTPVESPGSLGWLQTIVRRLLAPDGCPWDRKQTLDTLKAYLLEECYEVVDAIDGGGGEPLREELGDLLFQIVFQAELGDLGLDTVINGIGEKLIRRHPHVFGDATVDSAEQVKINWEALKAAERRQRSGGRPVSALDGVPRAMPALQRAHLLVTRAGRTGFDWPQVADARAKIDEELAEVDAASDEDRRAEEVGDLLLAVVGWARKLDVEPEAALRGANDRFEQRFRHLEHDLGATERPIADRSLEELIAAWRAAKAASR